MYLFVCFCKILKTCAYLSNIMPSQFILETLIVKLLTLREKCPYSELFWSVFSPNAGKYGPE